MTVSATESQARRGALRILRGPGPLIVCLGVAGWLGLWLLSVAGNPPPSATCAVCRMERVDHRLSWQERFTLNDTDCSRWYRDNVERVHDHVWISRGSCRRFGIPGIWGGYACSIAGPPSGLGLSTQVEIYRHFTDRLKAKELFIRVARRDPEGSRMWYALMSWVEADYPDTWAAWWEKERTAASVPAESL